MFKKPVNMAQQGDRIGLCVTQFEASQLERGLVSTPGYLPTVFGAIVTIRRISYYKCKILVCIAALYHRKWWMQLFSKNASYIHICYFS